MRGLRIPLLPAPGQLTQRDRLTLLIPVCEAANGFAGHRPYSDAAHGPPTSLPAEYLRLPRLTGTL